MITRTQVVDMARFQKQLEHNAKVTQAFFHTASTHGGDTSIDPVSGEAIKELPDGTRLKLHGTDPASMETPPPAGSITPSTLAVWLTSLSDVELHLLSVMVEDQFESESLIVDPTSVAESSISPGARLKTSDSQGLRESVIEEAGLEWGNPARILNR